MAAEFFIGLMSGTSLDGVDGVLADFSDGRIAVKAYATAEFPVTLRAELMALNTPGENELHRAALAGNGLARAYAGVVHQLLADSGIDAGAITAEHIHAELGELIAGDREGRTDHAQLTLYKSVGVAVQDAAAAALVMESARALGVGTNVET